MDLSKAFDTVNKDILNEKLTDLGLSNISIKLINSYMSDRKLCIGNESNQFYDLKHGVPQGSILGPLLFIAYTYDMTGIAKNNKIIVYADDTTVTIGMSWEKSCTGRSHCLHFM